MLLDLAGPDRVLLGSDYPFPIGDLSPRDVVEAAGLDEATVEAVLRGNAARVFGVEIEAGAAR